MINRPANIPPFNYEDDYLGLPPWLPPQSNRAPPPGHDMDSYNGALMRKDPQMARLLKAFRFLTPEQRDEIAAIAEGMRKPPDVEMN